MTPAKGFAEMKDSGIHWMGRIPNNWKLIRAKFHFTQTNNRGNETPILLAASQKYGVCPQSWLEGVVQVSENTDLQQFKTVHKNDFVISLRSFQGGFERSDFEGVCSPAYQVFHADNSFDNNFLKYLFKNELFIDEMNSLTVGIREGRNIKYEDFANSLIFVPPLDEQSAIAAYLDTQCAKIDEIIDQAKASMEDYKQWKASIIYEAVTKGLNPNVEMKDSGVEWIGKVPKRWACCKQKCVMKLINGRAYKDDEFETEGKYRVLRVGNLFSNPKWYYSNLELEEDKYCNNGDLLYAWSMSYGPVIWNGERVIYHYHIWKTKLSKELTTRFAYYYLIALSNNIKAESHATTMGFVTMKTMNNSYVAFPSLVEQSAITTYLDTQCAKIDDLVSEKQSFIDDLESYKKSLIYEVVTGKRRV